MRTISAYGICRNKDRHFPYSFKSVLRADGRSPSLPRSRGAAGGEGAAINRRGVRAHWSQAAFAKYTNLTTGYISQLERGTKKVTESTLAILNVIRRKGIEAVL